MQPLKKRRPADREDVINELLRQREEFVARLAEGKGEASVGIQIIDGLIREFFGSTTVDTPTQEKHHQTVT